jgi:hypothetical protein
VLLIGLPLVAAAVSDQTVKLIDSFYRSIVGSAAAAVLLLQAEVTAGLGHE